MGVDRDFEFEFYHKWQRGTLNLITDVPGVRVGHTTRTDPEKGVHTGCTVILPHSGNLFRDKCMAGAAVLNGFGKSAGLIQVEVLGTIDRELQPFASRLRAPITRDDLVRLTEIKIKRISKFDAFKADQHIRQLEEDIEQTQKNLNQLTKFTIRWFEALRKKYGAAYPRKTEISSFGSVNRAQVAVANETLYIDDEGFAGYGVKKGNPVCKCSTLWNALPGDRHNASHVVSRWYPCLRYWLLRCYLHDDSQYESAGSCI